MGAVVNEDRQAWAEGIRRVSEEAAGCVALQAVLREDLPKMIVCAALGDPEAARLVPLVSQTLRNIQKARPGKPMLCCACPKPLRGGRYSLVCVFPHRDDAKEAITVGVCHGCGTEHGAVLQAAARGLKRLWPDCRIITPHPSEGRA